MAKEKKKQSVKGALDQHLLFHGHWCHFGFCYDLLCRVAAA